MLSFEIKKLIKSRVFLFTILFSTIMSLYINYKSNNLDLTIDNPTYVGNIGSEAIFSMNFYNQYFKWENREQAIQEYSEINEKYSNVHNSKIVQYIANKGNQSFGKNYDIAKNLQELNYEFLENIDEFKHRYDIDIEDINQKNDYEYGLFESRYYHDNGILFTRANEEFLSTNYIRRIIYQSEIIFGIPFLIFMIITFYGILSKDKDEGTINLLKNQPIKNILLSKLMAMLFIAIVYTIGFLISFFIICKFQGIRINGFREIYRIFNTLNQIKYLKGYEVLTLILISYFVLVTFISTFIIFINTITTSKEASLALLIVIFGLAYTFTENNVILQNILNPIYAFDYLRLITGKIVTMIDIDGSVEFVYINQSSFIYLLIYNIYSLFLFGLSRYIFANDLGFHKKVNENQFLNNNIFRFEIRKIVKNNTFIIYILGALIFVFSQYYFQINDVDKYKRYWIGESGKIKSYQDEILKLEEELLYSNSDLDKEMINEEIELVNKKIGIQKRIIEGYNDLDSEKFYLAQKENTIYSYDTYGSDSHIFKYEKPIIFGKIESILLDEISIEKNVRPIIRTAFQYSQYEKFNNPLIENEFRNRETYLTNSSLYTNYRMLKYNNLDILFLLLVLFMVLGGYIYDKKNGNQLNLIYTQPIDKFKFHIIKIITQSLVIVLVYGIISIFIIAMGIIKEGLGDLNQPVIEYLSLYNNPQIAIEEQAVKTITTIPIYIYLIKAYIVIIFQALLLSAISTLISIFTKSKTVIIVGVLSVFVLGIMITNLIDIDIIKLLSPFSYIFASKIADNSIIPVNGMEGASYIISLTILLLSSIIISILGGIIVKNKDQI